MNDAMDDEIAALYRNLALLAEKQPGFRDEYDACFAALRRLQERRATELREQFRSERSLDPDVLDAAIAHADDLLNKHDVTNLRELQAAGRDDEPVLASSGISRSAQRHAAARLQPARDGAGLVGRRHPASHRPGRGRQAAPRRRRRTHRSMARERSTPQRFIRPARPEPT